MVERFRPDAGSTALTKYDNAKRALADVVRVDEVKTIHDKAVAMQVYARQAKDRVLIDHATEIRLRAERRAGELLKEMDKNQGAVRGKTGRKGKPVLDSKPRLRDLDINKSQSSRWQKLADLADEDFERVVDRARLKAGSVVDRAHQPPPKPRPPKRKPAKRDPADVLGSCVREVESVVRAAVAKMDPEERAGLSEQLLNAITAIMAEAAAQDDDDVGEETLEQSQAAE
jgi:hypothetical protein